MRDKLAQSRARKLRNSTTDAEQLLWQHLRRRQLGGYRFRRQVPIRGYIADFVCIEAKLVIELDGGQHQEQLKQDRYRDAWIRGEGYRVLRFWNNIVFNETTSVLESILSHLHALCPLPNPPPHAGEGT